MVDELLLEDEAVIRVFVDPLHQRMLQALLGQGPLTSAGLGRHLGLPAAKLHYHLKKMEEAGLLELDREELIRGIRARYLRPAARHFRLAASAAALAPATQAAVTSAVRQIGLDFLDGWDRMMAQTPGTQGEALGAQVTAEELWLTRDEKRALAEAWEAALVRAHAQDQAHRQAGTRPPEVREWALFSGLYPKKP